MVMLRRTPRGVFFWAPRFIAKRCGWQAATHTSHSGTCERTALGRARPLLLLVGVVNCLLSSVGSLRDASKQPLCHFLGDVSELIVLVAGRFADRVLEALDARLGEIAKLVPRVIQSFLRRCARLNLS